MIEINEERKCISELENSERELDKN